MKIIYFIAGFGFCYYLKKQNKLPDVTILEMNKKRIVFTYNGQQYTLNVGEIAKIGTAEFEFDGVVLKNTIPNKPKTPIF